ncbi:MAG: hypothetical protein PHQ59_04175 [Candidatus Daviesbacteria bacterium]|nr:hypothetical protein [Candidatus Daviesbacteria bacterium]
MGKNTRNFRQSAQSRSGDMGAKNYSQVFRNYGWHTKIINWIKVRGKGKTNV